MRSTNARTLIIGAALLALGGCTASGQGKASKPGWKTYTEASPRPLPANPVVRSGSEELRVATGGRGDGRCRREAGRHHQRQLLVHREARGEQG